MNITTDAPNGIPDDGLVFCTPAGVKNVKIKNEVIVGEWTDEDFLLVHQSARRGAIAEEFASCSSDPKRIAAFTKSYGPLFFEEKPISVREYFGATYAAFVEKIKLWREATDSHIADVYHRLPDRETAFEVDIREWLAAQIGFRSTWSVISAWPKSRKKTMPIIGTLPGEEFRLVDGQLTFRTADLHRFLLLDLFSVASERIRVCRRPDCDQVPYFIAAHLGQRYCTRICSDWAQREHRRKWWAKHGKEMRERQKVAKKKRTIQTRRKR